MPTPPTPTSVMNAASRPRASVRSAARSRSRPTSGRGSARTAPRRATGARSGVGVVGVGRRRAARRLATVVWAHGRRRGCHVRARRGGDLRTNRRSSPALSVGGLEGPGVGREPEPHVAGQDARRGRAGSPSRGSAARRSAAAAAAGRRRSPSSRRRTSAGRGRRPAGLGPATASSPGAPGRRAGSPARRARSSATKNGSVGSVERPPAVSTTSTASAAAGQHAQGPARPRPPRRRTYAKPATVDPSDSTLSRTLRSNRARSAARSDSFTMTPTRIGTNGATHTSGRRAVAARSPPRRR